MLFSKRWAIFIFCIFIGLLIQSGVMSQPGGHPEIGRKLTQYRQLLETKKQTGMDTRSAEEFAYQSRIAIQNSSIQEGLDLLDKAIAALESGGEATRPEIPSSPTAIPAPVQGDILSVQVDGQRDIGRINPKLWGTYVRAGENTPKGLATGLVYIDLERSKMFTQGESANPDNPANYNFRQIEQNVRYPIQSGIEPLVKIWSVPVGLSRKGDPLSAPKNYELYGQIIQGLVKHLTQNWGNGYSYPIQYFELWNEPDLRLGGIFWKGTQDEFFKTYETAARAIKSVNPEFIVGGPGFAWPEYTQSNPWLDNFLAYCNRNQVPLDFLSWHQYDLIPGAFFDKALLIDQILDKYPNLSPLFGKPKSFNTEWNMAVSVGMGQDLVRFANQFSPVETAAHNISAIIKMLDAGVDAAYRIPGTPHWSESSFTILNSMNQTPVRIYGDGSNPFGVGILAGKSQDGRLIQIIISHFNSSRINRNNMTLPPQMDRFLNILRNRLTQANHGRPEPYYSSMNLTINSIPWGNLSSSRLEHYILDSSNRYHQIQSKKYPPGENIEFDSTCPNPSVHLIKIYPE